MSTDPIVVGFDGSDEAMTAVRWAAHEARRRTAPLHVVLAYEWAWPGAQFSPAPPAEAEARATAEKLLAGAVTAARAAARNVEVTGTAVRGRPAQTLMDFGRDAALLVVGGRGHGGFVNLLLGSVSLQVATHAPGPVVVVRGHAGAETGPVIVGVDSSSAADDALAAAFEAASVRGCSLVAVRAYELPMVWGGYGGVTTGVRPFGDRGRRTPVAGPGGRGLAGEVPDGPRRDPRWPRHAGRPACRCLPNRPTGGRGYSRARRIRRPPARLGRPAAAAPRGEPDTHRPACLIVPRPVTATTVPPFPRPSVLPDRFVA